MAKQTIIHTGRARGLRKNHTDAESWLWQNLRRSQINGHRFRRQHPIGPYIIDFYCDAKRLAIELDGGQHSTHTAIQYDLRRTQHLEGQGIRVIRFWNNDIFLNKQGVLEKIYSELLM